MRNYQNLNLKSLVWRNWLVIIFGRDSLLRFLIKQRVVGFGVPSEPHFDSAETTDWFRIKLKAASQYLEYGSGGSTYLAAQLGLSFICVDSDKYFLESVKNKIKKNGLYNDKLQIFKHAYIGLTGPWGKPVCFKKPSEARLKLFASYSEPPEACLSKTFTPDLILVDGRFRVACALKIIKLLRKSTNWTLIVDDYTIRPQYKILENFGMLNQHIGRMAIFSCKTDLNDIELESMIKKYELISD
jgi:hypothetical protein